MEKIILSLKNIYRLLMNDDFPIYSERVIGKKQRKGQTLLRFWQDMMTREFCCLPCGRLIWRNDGTRNRYISNLCNRSDELKYYHEYARELGAQITEETVLDQIRRFGDFLKSREYNREALLYRAQGFLNSLKEDPFVKAPIMDQLRDILGAAERIEGRGTQGALFHGAYLLTVMTLYGAAGEGMNDPAMAVLRDPALGIESMWERCIRQQSRRSGAVRVLTAHVGLLQDGPLPKDRFFGREESLFDLREIAAAGGKCLLCGIGGVGKTEMLRQLIYRCREERLVDKLAIVAYHTDLAESLIRAFPELRQQDREESLRRVLHRLEKEAREGKLLLLVDNVTNGADTDPDLLTLAKLPCAVILSSRRAELEGFPVYELGMPTAAAGALIFRDNYGAPLSGEDRAELDALLREPGLCHPLTLRLMAKAARSKNWTVGQLRERLRGEGLALSWVEDDRTVRIRQIYAQLYPVSHIPKPCRELMELFTLLPYDSYCPETLTAFFPAVCPEREALERDLTTLTDGGWLERDDSGYSMHPLIAQCLRRKVLPQARLEKTFSGLCQRLEPPGGPTDWEEQRLVCRILITVSQFLTGSVDTRWLLALMDAMRLQQPSRHLMGPYHRLLQKLLHRCEARDDTVEIVYHTLLCIWEMDTEDAIDAVFTRQREALTVPIPRFMDFCVSSHNQLYRNRPELAEKMLRVVLETDAPAGQKASAYYGLITTAEYRGRSEEALSWGQAGAAFVLQHPECGQMQTFDVLSGLAMVQLKFGQGEEVRSLLNQMEKLEKAMAMPSVTLQYQLNLGNYELYCGQLEKAAEAMEKALAILEEYYGKDHSYYSTLNQLAIILQRQKRFDQAKEAYEQVLRFGQDQVYFNIARNNYAVLLMDMGRPEEAMPHISKVLSVARQQGGIALGEALRNQARAMGLLGDTGQEAQCLQQALPLLTEAYGPEHPRVAAAKERLAQLRLES